jgi:DNA-binding transcriptional regulator YiaG
MDIKKLRKANDLTQAKLAIKVGVSLTTIRLWEQGVTKPTNENMQKLETVLKVGE